MTSRHAIRGVLAGFLGTYTSRYSDYNGYWLFGFFVAGLQELTVDLLASPTAQADAGPESAAVLLARSKFAEQVAKAGLAMKMIREARLEVRKLPGTAQDRINGQIRDGFHVAFKVTATLDTGRTYERETTRFIAPHDPAVERRSTRRSL